MSKELAALFATRFIQRRDVKAVQFSNGGWSPDRELKDRSSGQKDPGRHGPLGFKMSHITDHIAGKATYGHYMLDQNDRCRVFAFDIDLEKTGSWVRMPDWKAVEGFTNEQVDDWMVVSDDVNPRELWLDRRAVEARTWYKYQMKRLGHKFAKVITEELELPCAVAYSGSKGIHVYGFMGDTPSQEVRSAAELAMGLLDEFEPFRGKNFFRHKNSDPHHGFPSFSVEMFPKQGSLEGKDLGNLMRLPLGRNLKTTDPTFFLDMTTPLSVFRPHPDPVQLLKTGNPFA